MRSIIPSPNKPSILNNVLIFEFGTMFVRVGVSGEVNPRHILPIKPESLYDEMNSISPRWNDTISSLLYNIYMYRLQIEPKSHYVVLLVSPLTPLAFTDALFSVLFELSVPRVKIIHAGTLKCIPLAIGLTIALVVDIGHIEARVGCVYQFERCDDPVLLDNSLQIVPCGFISFIRYLIECWNQYQTSNMVKENEDGITIYKAFISGKDTVCLNNKSLLINRKVFEDCLNNVYCNVSNPKSLLHAILMTLLSTPIDLKCSFAKNVIFVGGGLIALNHCHIERRIIDSVLKICKNNTNVKRTITESKFSSLKRVLLSSEKDSFSILYPLPFLASSMSWIGASIFSTALIQKRRISWIDDNTWTHMREIVKFPQRCKK